MTKDFDTDRAERLASDRDFTIGGETFRRRAGVRPETVARYYAIAGILDNLEALDEMDAVFLDFLEPESRDLFRARRADEVDPITFLDMTNVIKWFIEEETGRPTSASSGSSAGREAKDVTSSTGDSPSPEPTSTVSG